MFKAGDIVYYHGAGHQCWFWAVIERVENDKIYYAAVKWCGTSYPSHWERGGHDDSDCGLKKYKNPKPKLLEYMKALTAGEI